MVIVLRLKNEHYQNCFTLTAYYLFNGHRQQKQFIQTKQFIQNSWALSSSCLSVLDCTINLYVFVCFVLT